MDQILRMPYPTLGRSKTITIRPKFESVRPPARNGWHGLKGSRSLQIVLAAVEDPPDSFRAIPSRCYRNRRQRAVT